MTDDSSLIVVGRIGKTHGLLGWLKVQSYTEPSENILHYQPWYVKTNDDYQIFANVQTKQQANSLLAKFPNFDTPEQARVLTGADICIQRKQLPALKPNEYYWTDLEGLTVINKEGHRLGVVEQLFTAGNNDILVVKGEKDYYIPYVLGHYVTAVDLANKVIHVDWDADF